MKVIDLNPNQVVALYHEGFNNREVAELLGCSPTPILRILRDPELNPQGLRQRRIEFDEEELVRLYHEGMGGEQAMATVGAPRSRGWAVLTDPGKNPN